VYLPSLLLLHLSYIISFPEDHLTYFFRPSLQQLFSFLWQQQISFSPTATTISLHNSPLLNDLSSNNNHYSPSIISSSNSLISSAVETLHLQTCKCKRKKEKKPRQKNLNFISSRFNLKLIHSHCWTIFFQCRTIDPFVVD